MLPRWDTKFVEGIELGDCHSPLSNKQIGSVKYCDMIEEEHPGYLRKLFRYAQRTKGAKASFKELAASMNEKSDVLGESRTTLSLHKEQLRRWFVREGGKEYSAKEKPLDTDEQKKKRLEWVRKWFKYLSDPNCAICFLDEKFFYVTNRRRKIKRLPLGESEQAGSDSVPTQKMRNDG